MKNRTRQMNSIHSGNLPGAARDTIEPRASAVLLWRHDLAGDKAMSVSFTISDETAIVRIERPERRNAVNGPTAAALADAFRRFDADDRLSVAILTGAAGNFCAGADLKAISEGKGNRVEEDGDGPMGISRMRLSKPVIAAVEGYAVAGGCELALWCDLRVAARSAVFGIFCRRFGVPLIDLGTIRLPRLIGHSRAMDLILTGREVRGEEAFAIGLANRLVGEGEALDAALELARQIARFPQTCMRNDRLSAIDQWGMTEEEAMRNEFRRGVATIASGETRAGAGRFASGAGRHGGSVG
jgi:enoyl-CoA hydratase